MQYFNEKDDLFIICMLSVLSKKLQLFLCREMMLIYFLMCICMCIHAEIPTYIN